MIELARHIEILLLTNDCVIVPGLGGFVTHYAEALYEESEQLFLPPMRTIGFNPQLKLNDSLLVLSYTEAYDISYPEALRRIESEVNELRQHLETEGSFELNGIGQLMLNSEGNLQFEPCEAGILTPSLYGLGSFSMCKLAASVPDTLTEESQADHETITIKMSWLRNVAAIAASILAFFLIAPPVANTLNEDKAVSKMEFSVLPNISIPQEAPTPQEAEATQQDETETVSTQDVDPTTEAPIEEAKEEAPEVKKPTFGIVLASQVSRVNAENFVSLLQKKGYAHARISEHHSIRRVIYGSYQSQEEAVKELRTLRGSKFFEEAWVMEVKE